MLRIGFGRSLNNFPHILHGRRQPPFSFKKLHKNELHVSNSQQQQQNCYSTTILRSACTIIPRNHSNSIYLHRTFTKCNLLCPSCSKKPFLQQGIDARAGTTSSGYLNLIRNRRFNLTYENKLKRYQTTSKPPPPSEQNELSKRGVVNKEEKDFGGISGGAGKSGTIISGNLKEVGHQIEAATSNLKDKASHVGQRIQAAAIKWRMSDFYAVLGAGLLFFGIIVGPVVVEKMKKSNQDYENLEITDDEITSLIRQAVEYAKEVKDIGSVNSDDGSNGESSNVLVDASSDIVSRVLQTEAIQDALTRLTIRVLKSPEVLGAAQVVVKTLFTDLVNDPETFQQVVGLLNRAIQDDTIRKAVVDLVVQICEDEKVNEAVTRMIVQLGQDEEVMAATQELLTESAHKTLNDPDILDHSMEFAADVVGDDVVQRTSGEALWNTISYTLKPGFTSVMSAIGLSLVLLSLYLLAPGSFFSGGNSTAFSAEEAELLSSLYAVGRDLDGNKLNGLSSLWAVSSRLAETLLSSAVTVLLSPIRFMASVSERLTTSISGTSTRVIGQISSMTKDLAMYIGLAMKEFLTSWTQCTNAFILRPICGITSQLTNKKVKISYILGSISMYISRISLKLKQGVMEKNGAVRLWFNLGANYVLVWINKKYYNQSR